MMTSDHVSQFSGVLERAVTVLEAENAALRERRAYHVGELHARKAMALFELEQLGIAASDQTQNLRPKLQRLRELLGENSSLLNLHIGALKEVVDVLHRYQVGIESDGTYSVRSLSGDAE